MNFVGDDAKLLNVWQTFQFKFEGADKAASERADAVRSLMFQVHNLFDRGNLNLQQYQNMLDYYSSLYSDIVDEQDETKGLNNFAEQSIALASGFQNDSRNWKSSLTFESLDDFNISKIPAEEYNGRITKPQESLKPMDVQPTDVHKAPSPSGIISKSKSNFSIVAQPLDQIRDPVSKRQAAGPSFKPLFSKDNRMDKMYSTSRKTEADRNGRDDYTNNNSDYSYMSYKRPTSRSKPKLLENKATGKDEEQNDDIEFVTARQQFVINERKKKEKHENGQNMGSYGAVKKSLGYRRGPSNRFIPPVRNYDDDENFESFHSKRESRTRSTTASENNSSSSSEEVTDERLKGIEPKMVELIKNEIMDHGPPVDWHDIAGLDFAKTVIKEIVVWPMLRPDIFKGLRGPPKGLLLFGPPGTGKTLIGKCIASQSKATFFSISASSLTSKWVGEGEKMVRALFAVARCHQPAVIFIDEIDSLLSQRSDGEHDSSRRIKTEFLIQLDGAATSSDDRLLVVGATNRPQEIDEAARRRLVKRLYIPLPEGDARRQIISNLLQEQHYSLTEDDFTKLVERSEGYSGSDMSNLCREAALGPIRSISGNIQMITPDQVRPITFADFDNAFNQVRASVSSRDLDLYVEWNKQFGSGR